jgi:hypothetical protein
VSFIPVYYWVAMEKGKLFLFCEARAKLNVLDRAVGFSFFFQLAPNG